ncbi:MAG: extracellular solute-binding protein [Eubacteriales bacterium]|nr:extracellular solute-binding protein [Eubacteriales bacterium]
MNTRMIQNHSVIGEPKMKRQPLRSLALLLVITLTFALLLPLTACAKKPALDLGLDQVAIYDAAEYTIGEQFNYVQNMIWSNNEIIAMAMDAQGMTSLVRLSTDGQILGNISLAQIKNLPTTENMGSSASLDGFFAGPNGSLIVTVTDYSDPAATVRTLYQIDSNGTILKSYPIFTAKNDGSTTDYVQNLIVDAQGQVLLVFGTRVELLDTNGQKIGEYKLDGPYVALAMFMPNGHLSLSYYENEGGMSSIEVDLKTGTKIADISVLSQFFNTQPQLGSDGQYYLNGYQYLSRYDAATNEVVKIMSWLDFDLNRNNLSYYWVAAPDGSFYFSEFIYPESSLPDPNTGMYPNPTFKLVKLTKSADQTAAKKTTISIGAFWINESLRKAIIEFRKTHPDVRFTIYDYSDGIDYSKTTAFDDAIARINADIIAGKMPDMMVTNSLPWKNYASKGLFDDLGARMDKDKDFDQSLFLTNLIDAQKLNGKLYSLSSTAALTGIIASRNVVGDRTSWTVQDFQNIVDQQPDQKNVFYQMPGESILSMLLMGNLDAFIDKEAGKANFDSPEFIQLLEFAQKYGVPQDQMVYQEGDGMNAGEYIPPVIQTTYISRFEDYAMNVQQFQGNAVILGYPSPKQTGPMLQVSAPLAVAANSRNKELIWEFIKFTLSEDMQDQAIKNYEGFPLLRASLEKAGAQAIIDTQKQWEEQQKQEQQAGVQPMDELAKSSIWYGVSRVTQADVDYVIGILNQADTVLSYDEKANQLIYEESTPFFAGDKTAAETAASIQSRLKAYIGEQ